MPLAPPTVTAPQRECARGIERSLGLLASLTLSVALAAPSARAAPVWANAGSTDQLALNFTADAALTLGGLLFVGGTELFFKNALTPALCRFCDGPATTGLPDDPDNGRGTLNGLDAWVHDGLSSAVLSRKTADTFGNLLAFGLVPVYSLGAAGFAVGPSATPKAGLRAGVIVLEGVALAMALTQSLKFAVARNRPFVRYGHATNGATDEGTTYDVNSPDSRVSFPSGHTTAAAAFAFGAAMTAQLQDSPAAPWLWASAGFATALVGASRILAEKHYFTDVAAGAIAGAGCGVLVPLLHRPGKVLGTDRSASQLALHDLGLTASPLAGGTLFALAGRF